MRRFWRYITSWFGYRGDGTDSEYARKVAQEMYRKYERVIEAIETDLERMKDEVEGQKLTSEIERKYEEIKERKKAIDNLEYLLGVVIDRRDSERGEIGEFGKGLSDFGTVATDVEILAKIEQSCEQWKAKYGAGAERRE